MACYENTVQSCWNLSIPGANLDHEHEVFTIKNMYLIFKELNPELFEFEDVIHPGPDKTYDVDKMLPFTGWAHYNNVESCRRMEELWKDNNEAVNFALNSTKPSKSTIGAFLKDYENLIEKFDEFIKKFSVNLGLIGGKIIYWDGTILKSNCNNHKKIYPTQILYLDAFIKKYYYEYLNGKNNIWKMLKDYYYNNHMYAEELKDILTQLKSVLNHHALNLLKDAVLNNKKAGRILKRLENMRKNIHNENSISVVDPDSRHMEDKKGKMGLNYNYQVRN